MWTKLKFTSPVREYVPDAWDFVQLIRVKHKNYFQLCENFSVGWINVIFRQGYF